MEKDSHMSKTTSSWRAVLLKPSDSMTKAITVLGNTQYGIALVVDENDRLLGTITDGDVRRALLDSKKMESVVTNIMQRAPTVASEQDGSDSLLGVMRRKKLAQIPIVSRKGQVVDLKTMEEFVGEAVYDNAVFLMAGGFGTRLRPLTIDTPKPLLNVGGQAILETILEQFVSAGFSNFFIATHYKAEMVKNYFKDGSKWGVDIQYIVEDKPLGTAGALGLLPDNLSSPVVVVNGDLLTKVPFDQLLAFHEQQSGSATVCVREFDYQVPYAVLNIEGKIVVDIVEKPVQRYFINAGIYVLDPILISDLDGDTYTDMPDLLKHSISRGVRVNSFPIHEYWIDIGQIEEYARANREVHS